MQHKVTFVGNDLPQGHDWAMVQSDGETHLFIREGALSSGLLEEAWAAYRRLADFEDAPV